MIDYATWRAIRDGFAQHLGARQSDGAMPSRTCARSSPWPISTGPRRSTGQWRMPWLSRRNSHEYIAHLIRARARQWPQPSALVLMPYQDVLERELPPADWSPYAIPEAEGDDYDRG